MGGVGGSGGDACAAVDLFVEVLGDGEDQRYEAGPGAPGRRPEGSLGEENGFDQHVQIRACAAASSNGCIEFNAYGITMAGQSSTALNTRYTSPQGVDYTGYDEGFATLDTLGGVGAPMTGSFAFRVEQATGTDTLDLSGTFVVCRGEDFSL